MSKFQVKRSKEERALMNARGSTISELLNEDPRTPLYVLNTSDLEGNATKGDITINVRDTSGHSSMIRIVNTWIPLDLTEFFDKKMILDSPDFRKILSRGQIKAIPSDIASKILSTSEARNEKVAVDLIERNINTDTLKELAERGTGPESDRARKILATQRDNPYAQANEDADVTPQVVSIVNRENTSSRDMLNALKNISSITEKDMHYIISKVNGTSHSAVITWARDSIKNNAVEDDDDDEENS
jgi:hypothetical protein